MIDMLIAIAHWCASCAAPGAGVPSSVGAFGGGAGAAGGMGGMGGMSGDAGAGDGSAASEGSSAGSGPAPSDAGAPSAGTGPASPDSSPSPEPDSNASDNVGPAASTQGSSGPTQGPFTEEGPGWMDSLLGLNPNTSFAQTAMDDLGYGPDGVFGRSPEPGESDLTTLGRGLGAAAVSPVAGVGAIIGGELDELNHPALLHIGPEVSTGLGNAPTTPTPIHSPPPAPEGNTGEGAPGDQPSSDGEPSSGDSRGDTQ